MYWWRTPAGEDKAWAQLRQEVPRRTGHRLELDSVTAVADVVDAVYRLYGVGRGTGGMLDNE